MFTESNQAEITKLPEAYDYAPVTAIAKSHRGPPNSAGDLEVL
jgi:hypothetical protein